jgi:DNA repair protein RecN (Recombination protein N)
MEIILINRFYLKDYLSFDELSLEFDKGLIVFTGVSGAGKTALMDAFLSLFGNSEAKAKISEAIINDINISYDNYNIVSNKEFVIKQTNTTKTRYFLENQIISKKLLKEFCSTFVRHLHLRDTTDFQNDKIINFLDFLAKKENTNYQMLLNNFKNSFNKLKELKTKLIQINKDEQKIEELIEYTKFEISKIETIDPKIDEYDKLKAIKDNLSKREKIQETLQKCHPFLNNSHHITTALKLLNEDTSIFDDTINNINNIFERFNDNYANMDDEDIENILTRLEDISRLQKRYGSIEEAIKYKEQKKQELEKYENISFEKTILEKNIKKLTAKIDQLASSLTKERKKYIPILQDNINQYLKYLYLDGLEIILKQKTLDETGCNEIIFKLNCVDLNKISSGEFNRLRLALLTTKSKYECQNGGILFLDEIDANLSGKESESIAKVLNELSNSYQIFTISHQPQLSAIANQHFIVEKNNNISTVKLLNKTQRINEIARMISGKKITDEALKFAKKLLQNS